MRWAPMLEKVKKAILPWAPRADRKAAIDRARREKEHSRDRARDARDVKKQIRDLAETNHYADIIAADIIRGHRQAGT